MLNIINKMFGCSNYLKMGMGKEKLNKYDIALITLCKLHRININKQGFFLPSKVNFIELDPTLVKFPSCAGFTDLENDLISVLYNNISIFRNHHLVFFQYLVKLLINNETITPRRIQTFKKIGSKLVQKFGKEKIRGYIEKWTAAYPDFQKCFDVYYDGVGYYATFSRTYRRNWDKTYYREREIAHQIIYGSDLFDNTWYLWNYSIEWLMKWKKIFVYEKERQSRNKKYTTSTGIYKDRLIECYKVLEIQPTSDKVIIKSAYRKLCLKYHPDVGGSKEQFIKINQSYEYLIANA